MSVEMSERDTNQSIGLASLPYATGFLAVSTGSLIVAVLTPTTSIFVGALTVSLIADYEFFATLFAAISAKNSEEFYTNFKTVSVLTSISKPFICIFKNFSTI